MSISAPNPYAFPDPPRYDNSGYQRAGTGQPHPDFPPNAPIPGEIVPANQAQPYGGYEQQGQHQQGYSQQGFPQQGYPQQPYPQQGHPQPGAYAQPVFVEEKNVVVAALLSFFFRPLGMFHSTVSGALIMLGVVAALVILTVVTLGLMSFITIPVLLMLFIPCTIWGAMAADAHNKKVRAAYGAAPRY